MISRREWLGLSLGAGATLALIEFKLDGQGKVTGAIVEQGPNRIQLERK